MKKIIICGFLTFLFAAPYLYAAAQESNPDKKALREQKREARRQQREERRQDRRNEEPQEESAPVVLMPNKPGNMGCGSAAATPSAQQSRIPQKSSVEKEEPQVHKTPVTTRSSQEPRSVKRATGQSLPDTVSESRGVSRSSSEDGTSSFIGLLALVVSGIWILSKIFARKCSHCKKYRAMVPIEETYLGRVKTDRVKDNNGNISYVHYNRMRITRKCKYCGYQDRIVKTVKGDRE